MSRIIRLSWCARVGDCRSSNYNQSTHENSDVYTSCTTIPKSRSSSIRHLPAALWHFAHASSAIPYCLYTACRLKFSIKLNNVTSPTGDRISQCLCMLFRPGLQLNKSKSRSVLLQELSKYGTNWPNTVWYFNEFIVLFNLPVYVHLFWTTYLLYVLCSTLCSREGVTYKKERKNQLYNTLHKNCTVIITAQCKEYDEHQTAKWF